MQSFSYRENLKEALKNLIKVNESIYASCFDMLVQGELKEWNNAVPIGEEHHFPFEIFKNSADINIQLLITLMEKVDETFESIKNLNNIQPDEE